MLASPLVRISLAAASAIGLALAFVVHTPERTDDPRVSEPSTPSLVRTETRAPPASCSTRGAWTEGAVVYGAVPPLFGPGGYRAITRHLDALAARGVDALWLPPVHATDDDGQISYAITDHYALRPDFGTREELRTSPSSNSRAPPSAHT